MMFENPEYIEPYHGYESMRAPSMNQVNEDKCYLMDLKVGPKYETINSHMGYERATKDLFSKELNAERKEEQAVSKLSEGK